MKTDDAERYARIALNVARTASKVAFSGYRKPLTIGRKTGIELITEFDTATEDVIRRELGVQTPEVSVIGEEGGGQLVADRAWYVDPIDGTTNFAHGHPFWAVSIGLVVHGVPLIGAVVAPALGCEWVGWMGGPALRNGEPCQPATTTTLSDSLLATGFPYDRQTNPDNNFVEFSALKKLSLGVRRCGSAAIDLCFVADGTYAGFWERKLRPWDVAAGIAVVQGAGGRATSFLGTSVDVVAGHVVASNGLIHDALLQEIRRAREASGLGPVGR